MRFGATVVEGGQVVLDPAVESDEVIERGFLDKPPQPGGRAGLPVAADNQQRELLTAAEMRRSSNKPLKPLDRGKPADVKDEGPYVLKAQFFAGRILWEGLKSIEVHAARHYADSPPLYPVISLQEIPFPLCRRNYPVAQISQPPLGLQANHRLPLDSKTVWTFREALKGLDLVDVLFARFHEQLAEQGYVARAGQMIDATFVEVPKQRNTREENALIKEGQTPEAWDKPEAEAKRRQKDTEARWTKKNDEKHYGYKNHINADEGNKLIQSYSVTQAAVHDSQVFDELLDQTTDVNGNKRAV